MKILGRDYRIVAEMTREEYLADRDRRREQDRLAGFPPARAGTFVSETAEFKPERDLPANCRYFYRLELELHDFPIPQ